MKKIPLTKNKFSIIDDDDYEKVNQWKWNYGGTGYATRQTGERGHRKAIYMHRIIMNCPEDMQVDHINMDSIDNRKVNLRICTKSQQQQNTIKKSHNKSGYKGVIYFQWGKRQKRWKAQLILHGKKYGSEYFLTKEEAAKAYNTMAIKYFGEFARLNQI